MRGQDVGVKKSETELAKQRNNYAKCMQNPVGASQNRTEKNKRFFLVFLRFEPANGIFSIFLNELAH